MVIEPDRASKLQVLQTRYYALDASRAIALTLGVLYHSMESFVTYTPRRSYVTHDVESSSVLDFLFFALHAFRMQAFFLVAGFFARLLYHRQGLKGFILHRTKRIVLPLIIFWPIVYFLFRTVWTWGHQRMGYYVAPADGAMPSPWLVAWTEFSYFEWFRREGLVFPLIHLWFLYYLILIYAGVITGRIVLARYVDRSGNIRRWLDNQLSRVMPTWWAGLAVGVLIALPMCRMNLLFGVDTPNQNLIPNTRPLLVYALFFLFGWVIQRQGKLIEQTKNYRLLNLIISLSLTAVLYYYFSTYDTPMEPVLQANQAAIIGQNGYKALYGIASTVGVFAFIGYMFSFYSTFNQRIRYLSDASYWMYIVHFPLVAAIQVLVSQLSWPWALKLFIIFGSSLLVLLVSYHFFVRKTWIGVLLNGKRL